MWIHMRTELLDKVIAALDENPAHAGIRREVLERKDVYTHTPLQIAIAAAMEEKWVRKAGDGEIDFDDKPVVSAGDGGAYVMAWLWVDKDDVPEWPRDDEEEEMIECVYCDYDCRVGGVTCPKCQGTGERPAPKSKAS